MNVQQISRRIASLEAITSNVDQQAPHSDLDRAKAIAFILHPQSPADPETRAKLRKLLGLSSV